MVIDLETLQPSIKVKWLPSTKTAVIWVQGVCVQFLEVAESGCKSVFVLERSPRDWSLSKDYLCFRIIPSDTEPSCTDRVCIYINILIVLYLSTLQAVDKIWVQIPSAEHPTSVKVRFHNVSGKMGEQADGRFGSSVGKIGCRWIGEMCHDLKLALMRALLGGHCLKTAFAVQWGTFSFDFGSCRSPSYFLRAAIFLQPVL